jgi:DNA (cytosine-5)-methyltransferase 1
VQTHLDLFSGIGGFALAARWAGFRTIGFCEIDKYCQKILAKNFLADTEGRSLLSADESSTERGCDSRLDAGRNGARIHSDIFKLDGTRYRGVTLVTGGFPCQPFSVAGKRRGKADERHLWPEMLRVISEARPAWVLGENVAGIIGMELDQVLSDLETIGYATRTFVIPACGVDAQHRRNRAWIVANATQRQDNGRERGNLEDTTGGRRCIDATIEPCGQDVADTECGGQSGPGQLVDAINSTTTETREATQPKHGRGPSIWLTEPDVGRVAHGIPARVDRLRGLGNAIVPQVAYQILKVIHDLEEKSCLAGTIVK